ncbi:MAG TPA: tetratricopeptide repeat protein, partial [Alphaproteobacteria bacterium]|nr:tetratricopeptide repeat protein [Alphaproteobacteria bacterium]
MSGRTSIRRVALRAGVLLLAVAVFAAAAGPAGAESARSLVAGGNGRLRAGDVEGAIEQYERASVEAPESPIIDFNIGAALYRKGEFSAARERFVTAAEKTRELDLEARAWYNAGNCAFREGQRMLDGDLEQALEGFRESARFYTTALERNPDDEDAAWNLELARLHIKDVLDRIQKRQEETAGAREEMKEIADSLAALIERERAAVEKSDSLAAA